MRENQGRATKSQSGRNNWLAPWRIFALVVAAAAICVLAGAFLAIYPEWLETNRHKTGWLPTAEDVLEIQAYVWDEEQQEWISASLPLDTAPEILELLSRRASPQHVLPKPPPGRLVHYDFTRAFSLEMNVSDMRRPVRIAVTTWGFTWVGDETFVLPRDDFRKLEKLVLDHFYEDHVRQDGN